MSKYSTTPQNTETKTQSLHAFTTRYSSKRSSHSQHELRTINHVTCNHWPDNKRTNIRYDATSALLLARGLIYCILCITLAAILYIPSQIAHAQITSTNTVEHHNNCQIQPWIWPIILPQGHSNPTVLHPFSNPPQPWLAGHRGIDIDTIHVIHNYETINKPSDDTILSTDTVDTQSSTEGKTTIIAPSDGIIRFIGTVAGIPTISIAHTNTDTTLVSSLQPVQAVASLQVGDAVHKGQNIGYEVASHSFTHCANCIHWGVFIPGQRPTYINPLWQIHRQTIVLKPLN